MNLWRSIRGGFGVALMVAAGALCPALIRAEEHIVFTNGFELDCLRHETQPDTGKIRIYSASQGQVSAGTASAYLEVASNSIRSIEAIDVPVVLPVAHDVQPVAATTSIQGLLNDAGARHHIDADLLASLVNAESGGHATAVSRAGARGLMQLMPATAASFGVQDSFRPEQNIAGGTAYLDQLLTRFHDDITLALAAYNAGPGAVERWHGVPPYRETRAYVARIVNEYNRRKKLALAAVAVR